MSNHLINNIIKRKLNGISSFTKDKIKQYYESVKEISDPYNTKYHYQKTYNLKKSKHIFKLHEENESFQQVVRDLLEMQLVRQKLKPQITYTKHPESNELTSITIDISKLVTASISAWRQRDVISEEGFDSSFSKSEEVSIPKKPSDEYKFKGVESGFEEMKRLRKIYIDETGKRPVIRGKRTSDYRRWVRERKAKERSGNTELISLGLNMILLNYTPIESLPEQTIEEIYEIIEEIHHIYSSYLIDLDHEDQAKILTLLTELENNDNSNIEFKITKEIVSIYTKYDDAINWTNIDLDRLNILDKELIDYGQDPTWAGGILLYESDLYDMNFSGNRNIQKESIWKSAERGGEKPTIEHEIRKEKEAVKSYVKSLRDQYKEETGKPPIISGKKSNQYKRWLRKKKEGERIEEYQEDAELREQRRAMKEEKLIDEQKEQDFKIKQEQQKYKHKMETKEQQSKFKKESKEQQSKKSERSFSVNQTNIPNKTNPSCNGECGCGGKDCVSKSQSLSLDFLLATAYNKKITVEIEGLITFFLNYERYNIGMNMFIDYKTPEVLDDQKNLSNYIQKISGSFAEKLKILIQP